MELKEYLRIVQRWLWLLLLGLALGGACGYAFSRYQQPAYQASTRAMVMTPAGGGRGRAGLPGQPQAGQRPADP
jgi:uncharacterized protein involved in exopolysaccharide biosynthesis